MRSLVLWRSAPRRAPDSAFTASRNPTVPAGATEVMTLSASEPVTWEILPGGDKALFALDGAVLSFVSPAVLGAYTVRVLARPLIIVTLSVAVVDVPAGALTLGGKRITYSQKYLTWEPA